MQTEINNLHFGNFTLDRYTRELRKQGALLPISGKAFDLLAYMAANAGRPLTKAELLDAVWPETTVEESNLSQNVFLLRKILGADGPIKTLPGRGYQFAAQVTEIQPADAPGTRTLPAPVTTSTVLQTTHTRVIVEDEVEEHRSSPLLIAIVVCIGLAAAGLFLYRRHPRPAPVPAATLTAPPSQPRQAVAVLGFHNLTDRPEHAWLSTAVAEMLASDMSSGDRLRVIPSEDIARAQSDIGIKAPPADDETRRSSLQQAIGADMLVEGSYVLNGGTPSPTLRLMVKVIDAHSGKQLASLTETGRLDSLFALVDQAGAELRKNLTGTGSPLEEQQALSSMSHNTEALRLYAEGLERQRNFDSHSARSLFERSVAADPDFAMAHLGLSDVWADLGFMERAAAESAVAYKLSNNLPRAQRLAVEANYREYSKQHEQAISLYKSLQTFYPDDQRWGLKLASVQRRSGHRMDAVDTLERLRHLPLTPSELVELNGLEAVSYAYIDDPASNDKARSRLKDAVSIADTQGGLLIHGRAFRWECFALSHIGPVPSAQAACERSKTTFQAIGNLQGVEAATNNLGVLAQQVGDWKLAEADYEEARRLDRQLGNREYEVMTTLNLAHLDLSQGELARAIKESIQLSHLTGTSDDDHTAFNGHFYAAWALLESGKLKEAKAEALQAEHSADKEHPRDTKVDEQSRAREVLAWIAFNAGNIPEAQALFHEALTLTRPNHDETDEALFTADEAATSLDQGRPSKQVLEDLRHATSVLSRLQDESDEAISAGVTLTRLELQSGALEEASSAMAAARALDSKGDSLSVHLSVLLADADLQQSLGHPADARRILQEEVTIAKTKGYAYNALSGEIALAKLDAKASPRPENIARLHTLKQEADHSGFKGLAKTASSDSLASRSNVPSQHLLRRLS